MKRIGRGALCVILILAMIFSFSACNNITTPELKPEGEPINKSLSTPPTKTIYGFGEVIDPAGAVIKNYYANDTTDTYTASAATPEIYCSPAVIADYFWHSSLTVDIYCDFGKIGSYEIAIHPPTAMKTLTKYSTDDICFFYPENLVRSEFIKNTVVFYSETSSWVITLSMEEKNYYVENTTDNNWLYKFENECSTQGYTVGDFNFIHIQRPLVPNTDYTPRQEWVGATIPLSKDGDSYAGSYWIFKGVKTYILTVIKNTTATQTDEGTVWDASDFLNKHNEYLFVKQG